VVAELEGEVGGFVEGEILLGLPGGSLPGQGFEELVPFVHGEVELDGGAGQVPGRVLGTDEVVAAMVIEGVCFEDPAFG
jgi:hypothetical protein